MGLGDRFTDAVVSRAFEYEPIKEAYKEGVREAAKEATERQERVWESRVNELQKEFEEQRARAYEAGYFDGNDDPQSGDIRAGKQGYKRISDSYVREGKIDFQKALETAWTLWQKSPIAKRVLSLKRDHIIGHNATPTADDDGVVEIVTDFWNDNKLDKRSSEFVIQLFGLGEQCYPVFVRQADGRVRLGYIDPASIVQVIKHPDNTLEDWAVCVRRETTGLSEKRVYRIIREDEGYVDEELFIEPNEEGKLVTAEQAALEPWEERMIRDVKGVSDDEVAEYDGSCFYTKVNAASNQPRGMSDLLQVADWIDQIEEVLFGLADREVMAGWFAFDVTLEGGDPETIKKRKNEIAMNPPKKGSVNIHNDSEEWQQWAPNLGQTGTVETFRALLGLILGGMGFPVHWYGFGDDANRATATVQGAPTEKSLEHDQGIVKDMFLSMCQFAVDQAEIAGGFSAPDDYEITLSLPEVTVRDIAKVTTSLSALAQALVVVRDSGWITNETSVSILAKVIQELGVEIDPVEELKAAEKELEQREIDREQARQNALAGMMAQNGDGSGANGQAPEDDEMMDEMAG